MRLRVLLGLALLLVAAGTSAQTTYLAFGDSITEGIGDTDESQTGYPTRLRPLLVAGGVEEARVENHGLAGEETPQGLSRLGSILNGGGDFILIMEGTNDIVNGEISTETTAFNLVRMTERARDANVTPVLATVIPLRPDAETIKDFELAKALRNKSLTEKVDLVDNYAVFSMTPNAWPTLYNTDRKPDNVGHPNAAGYDVLAQSFADVLLGVDTVPPVLGKVEPADGASDVSKNVTISVVVFDHGVGIDTPNTTMLVNGEAVSAERTGSKVKSTFTYDAPQPLKGIVTVEIDTRDLATPANSALLTATQFSTAGTAFLTGDINKDGRVDGFDLVELAFSFGKSKGDDRYRKANDLDKNGKVDGADLAILAKNFGKTSG